MPLYDVSYHLREGDHIGGSIYRKRVEAADCSQAFVRAADPNDPNYLALPGERWELVRSVVLDIHEQMSWRPVGFIPIPWIPSS